MNINLSNIQNNIFGNDKSINFFLKNLSANNDGNIWMLNGPKGIGKSTLTKLISANLLKIKYNNKKENTFFHPDLIILSKSEKKHISVDEIRNLKKLFFKTSYSDSYRIAIIDSINDINLHGHNALLKTIEEPPENSFIFIINHQNNYIPATIKSRCKLLNLNSISDNEVLTILKKMNFSKNEKELFFYSKISNGSVGDAIYFLTNKSLDMYKLLCDHLIQIQDFDENNTNNIINKITDNKNALMLVFFKLLTILINKVIKKKFLGHDSNIIEEEKLLIEHFNLIYNEKTIFYIKDLIEYKYNSFISLNTDLHSTLYSLLIEMHKIVKNN